MNPTLMTGTCIVTFALIAYSIGAIAEQKRRIITNVVIIFLTIGIILDITATIFMIAGSRHIPITVHGFIGYSALLAMLIDTISIWRAKLKNLGVSNRLHVYTRFSYAWWVIAYVAGGIIAMFHLY
ncbi:MAG TPA: hypothetical protein VF335_06545 [Chitinivibrionales bacterium]